MFFDYNGKKSKRIVHKIEKHDVIDNRELIILQKQRVNGLCDVKLSRQGNLEYIHEGEETLFDYLSKPISEHEFYKVISQALMIIGGLEKHNLFTDRLLLDLKKIYINKDSMSLSFMYIPIVGNNVVVNIRQFLLEMAYCVENCKTENEGIKEFILYLKNRKSVEIDEVNDFIKNKRNTSAQSTHGSGFITDKVSLYYEHYDVKNSNVAENDALCYEEGTVILDELEDDYVGTDILEDNEGDYFEDTTLLEEEENIILQAKLFRESKGHCRIIDKSVFVIGKDTAAVDFYIGQNNTISRRHAEISREQDRYFLVDLESTNHTYLNGEVVEPGKKYELFNGDKIVLSNEEFNFILEEV